MEETILFVYGSSKSNIDGAKRICCQLRRLGYRVEEKEEKNDPKSEDARGKVLVFISSSVNDQIGSKFLGVESPVLVANAKLFVPMKMALKGGQTTEKYTALRIIEGNGQKEFGPAHKHPMAAGFYRQVPFSLKESVINFGAPSSDAIKIAQSLDCSEEIVIFGYDRGDQMVDYVAPARRVGFFLTEEAATNLTKRGWALFEEAVGWATGEKVHSFDYILHRERRDVFLRRVKQRYEEETKELLKSTDDPVYHLPKHPPKGLTGLALSGGGVRSATFNLGLLQALRADGWLRLFDYLSTVSGGGYVGGWWSAWMSRNTDTATDDQTSADNQHITTAEADKERKFSFDPHKLHDPRGFLRRITKEYEAERKSSPAEQKKKSLAVKVWEMLPEDIQKQLDAKSAHDEDGGISDDCVNNAFHKINQKLGEESLYTYERFQGSGIFLTTFTYFEVEQYLDEEDKRQVKRRRLNQMLLQEAYPHVVGPSLFPPVEWNTDTATDDQPSADNQHLTTAEADKERKFLFDPHRLHDFRGFLRFITKESEAERKSVPAEEKKKSLAVKVWEMLPDDIQKRLDAKSAHDEDGGISDDCVNNAFREINQKLGEENLYTYERFQGRGVFLTTHTYFEVEQYLDEEDTTDVRRSRLNQMLLQEAYPHEIGRSLFPPDERIDPKRDEEAAHIRNSGLNDNREVDEDLLSAGNDPIHHLRLFGNFLTPRKGLLSGDTWRALAQVSRNLVLTWLILLPILFALILSGQLIFALQSKGFLEFDSGWEDMRRRLFLILRLAGLLLSWVVLLTIVWIIVEQNEELGSGFSQWAKLGKSRSAWLARQFSTLLALLLVVLSTGYVVYLSYGPLGDFRWWLLVFVIGAVFLIVHVCITPDEPDKQGDEQWRKFVRMQQITSTHTILLVIFITLTLVLFFSGFGPDSVSYVWSDASTIRDYVVKGASFLAIIMSVAGSIFTAVKSAPSGGDERRNVELSLTSRIILSGTPPLVLLVLATHSSWVAKALFNWVWKLQIGYVEIEVSRVLIALTSVGICLSLLFLFAETRPTYLPPVFVQCALVLLLLIAIVSLFVPLPRSTWLQNRYWPVVSVSYALLAMYGFLRFLGNGKRRVISLWFCLPVLWAAELVVSGVRSWAQILPIVFGFLSAWVLYRRPKHQEDWPARWLLIAIVAFNTGLLYISFLPSDLNGGIGHTGFGMLGVLLTWVIAVGWMSDPNLLSLHTFYRVRLLRAYLGASNARRSQQRKYITQSSIGDDMFMRDLENCYLGGPYHLVNTTLNLVAGRDLSTAQRSATAFVMSKRCCGSSRTGYRDTREYMGGALKLSTAIAVSGAAASPSMGSMTPTASLAMLMTLLNVRMGFWAPTPNKSAWRSPQARLWPFLTVQEFFSQTNDLGPFCYLTDGAHFENTGIYSLIERGCRFIVAADCGADPRHNFQDLGQAMRRCRIDFGTEFDLDLTPLMKDKSGRSEKHFVVGSIIYSSDHLKRLNANKCEQEGVIIILKPTLTGNEDVDVMQYGRGSLRFPQEKTLDQWYDEAQFESYRKLGELSARALIDEARKNKEIKEIIKKLKTGDPIESCFTERIFMAAHRQKVGAGGAAGSRRSITTYL